MLDANVALMGALAGFTIFLGLPIARLKSAGVRLRGVLNSVAIGILLFLVVEVVEHSWSPVEEAFAAASLGAESWSRAVVFFAIFGGGIALGLLLLVWFEGAYIRAASSGNGTMETAAPGLSPERLAMLIAVGIGLHNFSEGLAIGAAAASGAASFAVVLAVGFALHNATEGFGIAAPLAGIRPSWGYLRLLGLIGGGPTFVGSLLGALVESPYLSVAFLSLAAGALIYVIRQLFLAGRVAAADPRNSMVIMAGLVVGICLGFGTELVIQLAGI